MLGLACCLPWCNPARLPPNAAFWGEWVSVLLVGCWLASRLWRGSDIGAPAPRRIALIALAFPALAGLILAQIALRMVRSLTESMVVIAVILLAGAASVAGGSILQAGERTAALRAAAWGLLAALLLNAIAVVMGWAGYAVIGFEIAQVGIDTRAVGLIGQANQLGTLTVMALAAATWLRGQGYLPTKAWWTLSAIAAVVCAASGSRIALVEWLLVLALMWWHGRGVETPTNELTPQLNERTALAGALGMLVAAQLAWVWIAPAIVPKAQTAARTGTAGRAEMLHDGLTMWWQHPWLGVGQGNYASARLFELTGSFLAPHADNAHNILVQALAEWGSVGFLIVAAALLLLLRAVVRREAPHERTDHVFAATVVLCLIAHSMVEHPLWFVNLILLFAVFAGLLRSPLTFKRHPVRPHSRAVQILVMALAVGGAAIVGFDYLRLQRLSLNIYAQGMGAPDKVSRRSIGEISRIALNTLYPTEAAMMQARAFALDTEFAEIKLAVSEQALRGTPAPETVARYVACAALAGHPEKGRALLTSLASRNAWLYAESVKLLAAFASAHALIAKAVPQDAALVVAP